ncbi:hypothetical protein JCM10908_004986 [Rhodotorula pacifica]|uniref:uncharacterized protein n=1 Tax=Rhodotorula pacifica TaxID=1495444 RepID=UPI003178FD63
MAPRARSSTAKASAKPKASLGFGSTKKGGVIAAKQQATKSAEAKKTLETRDKVASKSELVGLYPRLYKQALREMGTPIHRAEMDDIEIILRVFDANEEFGPCSRMTRLERWERAEKLGLEPDPEIAEILRSDEGRNTLVYRDSVFQSEAPPLSSSVMTYGS